MHQQEIEGQYLNRDNLNEVCTRLFGAGNFRTEVCKNEASLLRAVADISTVRFGFGYIAA
jgi:hypothetical protein